jgi:ATP-binding cassette subfamily F protein 3
MLQFDHVSLHRGGRSLLADVNVTVHSGWKCGITGPNGSGKSTLLALIRGELHPDNGTVKRPANWTLAHVAQELTASDRPAIECVLDGDAALREVEAQLEAARAHNDGLREAALHAQLDAMDAWTARARAARLLHGLGFSVDDEQRPANQFSGGWRMRLNLAQALMCRSDLLLLDEPTNHLDLDAVLWLEEWLRGYRGTLLLIAHDRDFLDRVTDHILHLEAHPDGARATLYTGNYSDFERQRAAQLSRQQAEYQRQQREVSEVRAFVERFRAKATKARQAQSRLKLLERMPEIAPAHADSPFHFEFRQPAKLPSPLLQLMSVSAGYGQRAVLTNIDLTLLPGDRLGLLGPNGAGKSTLVRLLAGVLPVIAGERLPARDLKIGYFAQHQLEQLRPDDSPLRHLSHLDPQAAEQDLRDFLGGFGFRGDRVNEPVAPFSGGEKARLVLALIVWQKPNLLLLDEPTNHLDLDMRHALTVALQGYEGALVVVSHDRFLLQSVADKLLRVHDGSAGPYDGDLEDYANWLAERRRRMDEPEPMPAGPTRKDQRRAEAEKRRRLQPLKKQLGQLEAQLEQLGAEKSRLDLMLADNTLYSASEKDKLKALLLDQARLQQQLVDTESAWLQACEALETASRD